MQKIRRFAGLLLVAIVVFKVIVAVPVVLYHLKSSQLLGLSDPFVLLKTYPFGILSAITVLFHIFLLWLGILFIREKFNKGIAAFIIVFLVFLLIQNGILRRQNAGIMNQVGFMSAVAYDKPGDVTKIIKGGFDPNAEMYDFNVREPMMQPLSFAISFGRYDIVKVLVENGADVNAVSSPEYGGYTVLSSALIAYPEPDMDIVRFLLEKGADVNKNDASELGTLPLIHAVLPSAKKQIDPGLVQLLLDHGADVNKFDANGNPVMTWLVMVSDRSENTIDIMKMLIAKGADVNLHGENTRPPIYFAVSAGKADLCWFLIDNGADIDWKDGSGKTLSDFLKESSRTSEQDKAEIEKVLAPKIK